MMQPMSAEATVIRNYIDWVIALPWGDKSDENYEHHVLEALWLKQTHNQVDAELLNQMLNANDHRARAAAVRVLSFWLDRVPNYTKLIENSINDDHPRVRLEGVRACSFLDGDEAIEMALGVLEHDVDDYIQYTLDETMRALEQ